jgi:hypothetical protein
MIERNPSVSRAETRLLKVINQQSRLLKAMNQQPRLESLKMAANKMRPRSHQNATAKFEEALIPCCKIEKARIMYKVERRESGIKKIPWFSYENLRPHTKALAMIFCVYSDFLYVIYEFVVIFHILFFFF